MNANTGKRGGKTSEVEAPGRDEIERRCAVIRASWGNTELRQLLGLKPIPDPPEIIDRLQHQARRQARRRAVAATGGRSNSLLTEAEVLAIRAMLVRHPPTVRRNAPAAGVQSFLARWFGVQRVTICKIHKRAIWKHAEASH